MNILMRILEKAAISVLLLAIVPNIFFVHSTPSATSEAQLNFSGWKPMIKPEALTTDEFAQRLATSKQLNATDMEAADTKRSFLLVYPPRALATQEEPQKIASSEESEIDQGPSSRTYQTQSRHNRMMNFGGQEGHSVRNNRTPAVYQRPKFPPVANPPPLPEHAMRNRQRVHPNFSPESTSNHQVQIQLLDGYIVPPAGGGVAANTHTPKKGPQITTFPLNLNNVPEIRLLLPGDVHQQLNNLRQHPQQQQNRHANNYANSQSSDGRGNGPQREFQYQIGKTSVHSFESQRRPGRAEYGNDNRNSGGSYKTNGNGRPQPNNYNQNQDQRQPGKEFSPPDPAVYPEAVSFPGQSNPNYQNNVNNPSTYNSVKTYTGDNTPNVDVPNRSNYPSEQTTDSRAPVSQKSHSSNNAQSNSQNYGAQQNPNPSQGTAVNAQNSGISTQRFQRTREYERESFKPLANDNTNFNSQNNQNNIPSPTRNQNNAVLGSINPNNNINYNVQTDRNNNIPSPHNKNSGVSGSVNPNSNINYNLQTNQNNNIPSPQNQNSGVSGSISPNNNINYNAQTDRNNNVPSPHNKYSGVSGSVNPNSNINYNLQTNQNNNIPSPQNQNSGVSGSISPNNNINYNAHADRNNNNPFPTQNQNNGAPGSFNTKNSVNSNNGDRNTQSYDNRNIYQNGWQATQSNRGKQNYNRVLVPPGKSHFYSDNSGNQNTNFQSSQDNNFNAFGDNINQNSAGSQANVPQGNVINQVKTDNDNYDSSQMNRGRRTSATDFNTQPNFDNRDRRTSNDVNTPPNFGDRDRTSANDFNTQSNFDDKDRRTSANDFNTPSNFDDRDRRTNDFNTQANVDVNTATSPRVTTEDIYFVPPVLSQETIQTQIEPFDNQLKIDTAVSANIETPVNTGRGDGVSIDQIDFENVNSVGTGVTGSNARQTDGTFERTTLCECSQSCAPTQRSNENLGSSIREIARSLNADAFFDFVGLSDEEIENTLASDGSYTFFIPSNDAVSRLPSNLIDHWRENNPDLTLALLNHVVRDRISLDQLKLGGRMTSRANDATLFINNYNNEAVTVNGHRIVHGDVTAPKGGIIHVVDGALCPVADQDIINTLRTCNKYDGFLTLADVTKLLDTMQDDGPYTVFLPSNEALTKIPADELAVLKENATVLREFLEYHIVRGAYFSGDLKDGQYLTTLHDRQPIRMGIRVDGCYRRLVEVNNSPLFKSDIPTKNGVIHVVDWILRPSDLKWCDGVVLP